MQKSMTKVALVVSFLASASAIAEPATGEATAKVQNNACGVVSIFKKPPETKNIYRVAVNKVNGKVVQNSPEFKLSAGKHKFKVIELIQDSRFTRRRGEMKNYKDFEINVEPNMKYNIGAKYIRKNRSKLKSGEYWEPVIWKSSSTNCKI